jgi:uncharacterized Zn-binding protein involved in type VI secretion
MENVNMTKSGNVLTIMIDLTRDLGPSKSGKGTVIASTHGNISVPGQPEIKIGINCYKPRQ